MLMQPFKTLLIFLSVFIYYSFTISAQVPVKKYEAEWKKVQAFGKKNQPKSAFNEVKKIYDLAKAGKQEDQVIKALIYMVGLQSENRENNELLSIREIEAEITTNKQPATAVLKNILAEYYWAYFQEHRWQLYDRTKTYNYQKYDITSWDAEDFHKKITELYLQSIQNERQLQDTRVEVFDAVILKGNTRQLRPTLYDLLAHRALEYFQSDEQDIKRPAYAFEINQSAAFDPAADFITRKFATNDSLSLKQKALTIYQKLIALHINDKNPAALLDVDIDRIQFVYNNAVHPLKDSLYFNAINHLAKQYNDLPAAAEARFLLASYYNNKASQYKAYGDSTYRLSRLKAKEICEQVIKQKEQTEGWVNCYNLLQTINRQSFSFQLEKVNVPGQPFRVFVDYYNLPLLYFRIIQPDENLKKELDKKSGDDYWKLIANANPLRSWNQNLPGITDLQNHKAEAKVDELPAGEYILVASNEKDFKSSTALIGAKKFYVSNISYVNNENDFFVLDREKGQPLSKALVQIWINKYDYKTYKYILEKEKVYTTDEHGYFKKDKIEPDERGFRNSSYRLDISYKGERLFVDDDERYLYNYREEIDTLDTKSIFFFTDRSIYRPGQLMYFKGIAVSKDTNKKNAELLTGFETWVYLRDANYQYIDSIKLSTNEYGSFSGKFQLPETGLNGVYLLDTKKSLGTASFRVEEYKRPKFYVDYEKLKWTYQVNDKIKVTGIAKAYAGNNIDGAKVKYRVVREARFLYPWLFRRWWQPPTQSLEITHGEMTTDNEGKFVVEFSAIPDLTIDKKFDPVFDYRVYADITDINGETRSGELLVSAGYKSILLKTAIPESIETDSLKSLSITTENMNGEFVPAVVKVVITGLKEEKRLIRKRYWDRPDQFIMSKTEYINYFPHDEYDNETDPASWEKEKIVFEYTDSTNKEGEFKIENISFEPGWYIIEITTMDKNGELAKDVKYIELTDENKPQLTQPSYLWAKAKPKSLEPGEKDFVKIGTAANNVFVIQQTDRQNINYDFLNISNEKKSFVFSTNEKDRGGYWITWMFVKQNRVYQYTHLVVVSWSNKDLDIEYATFRDKTLPGSEEQWKIKISGYKKDKVAAEMLASMYDASLDQFYPHQWLKPSLLPSKSYPKTWTTRVNFMEVRSGNKYIAIDYKENKEKKYDQLISKYVFSPQYKGYGQPLWWLNPLDYPYDDINAPRLMSLPKPAMRGEEVMADFNAIEILKSAPGLQSEANQNGFEVLGATAMDLDSVLTYRGNKYGRSNVLDYFQDQSNNETYSNQIRKNFNETAFFFPDLNTNENGDIEFSFSMPEALTKWKFQAMAHTKDLALGYSTKEIITQKQLMVQPNAPRFLREGDKIELSVKIVNLSEKEMTGQAELQLFDAATNQSVSGWFQNVFPNQYFTVPAGQSEAVTFPLQIPYLFDKALLWRIVARSGENSDGEEAYLPVLTNRMLVTESLPMNIKGTGSKDFQFTKLVNSGNSESLQHQSLTLEFTSNPIWYAVQALPYLMEYPYECAEQTWNRYYANALATMIVNSSPRIRQIFENWKSIDTAALLSNLQKNSELKAVLLEETPWVLHAKSEEQQKKNIALLFDLVRMSKELNVTYEKLKQMQSSNGGFVWFKGGPDSRYITQYILTGIGHLQKMGVDVKKLSPIVESALPYLDKQIEKDYADLKKSKADLNKYTPGSDEIQYLYMRSFFPDSKIVATARSAYNFFEKRAKESWSSHNKYMQGMIALISNRNGDKKVSSLILQSLKETSITNEELGMYWKENTSGWFWHQAPVETQSLLIEAFYEIGNDQNTVNELRIWLLKNKQTTNWKTTKATAEACYALLVTGSDVLLSEPIVEIKLGNTLISLTENKTEAGTGYFKKTFNAQEIAPAMGNISVKIETRDKQSPQHSISWGSVYWQYFEDLDKITTAATPLKLDKKLFIEKNTDRGPVLTPVNEGDFLKVGDKIKVRIELLVDRDMEFLHMKDMRASCMEPVNVLSSYKWQGGLGYYETTKDASTNFFFDYVRKGNYVFEYSLFVTHTGNFSNGITSIQSMYAPEFTSHSEGVRVNVE